jgi:hypothetical protein
MVTEFFGSFKFQYPTFQTPSTFMGHVSLETIHSSEFSVVFKVVLKTHTHTYTHYCRTFYADNFDYSRDAKRS